MSTNARKDRMGPLTVHPGNPRYFADGDGNAVYLAGSHTWNNFKDCGFTDPPRKFDFDAYIDAIAGYNHNFLRLWHWEQTRADFGSWVEGDMFWSPFAWVRSGPGEALDGKPKFDLSRFDESYFERLRSRVIRAGESGVYVSIMLFEGWGFQFAAEPWCWAAHPMNAANNVNGIDGNPDGAARNLKTHTLEIPEVTRVQEAYLRKLIDTVNDLDNVLYEVTNESGPYSTDWQYHVIDFVHEYEKTLGRKHPVGMTFQYEKGSNKVLFDSPADWISPNPEGGYATYPPVGDGSKVIVSDTDHLWGIGGSGKWAWRTFTRGHNLLFMDPWDLMAEFGMEPEVAVEIRRNVGYTRDLSERLDMAEMLPRPLLASSGYCLAGAGGACGDYVVYLPEGGSVTVDLSGTGGTLAVEWFAPSTGESMDGRQVEGGDKRWFTSPLEGDRSGEDVVLFISGGKGRHCA